MKKEHIEPKVDRRIQKTKKILFEALTQLVQEKGYEAVTIQEIIDVANVGRSTFYSHYENKEQLLFSGLESIFSNLLPLKNKSSLSSEEKLIMIYEHAASHCKVAKPLFSGGAPVAVKQHLFKAMLIIVQVEYPKSSFTKETKLTHKFITEATAEALVKMLLNWLEADLPFSPKVMAQLSGKFLAALPSIRV